MPSFSEWQEHLDTLNPLDWSQGNQPAVQTLMPHPTPALRQVGVELEIAGLERFEAQEVVRALSARAWWVEEDCSIPRVNHCPCANGCQHTCECECEESFPVVRVVRWTVDIVRACTTYYVYPFTVRLCKIGPDLERCFLSPTYPVSIPHPILWVVSCVMHDKDAGNFLQPGEVPEDWECNCDVCTGRHDCCPCCNHRCYCETCDGVEVVSPPFKTPAGFAKLEQVCIALFRAGGRAQNGDSSDPNHCTGLHVHVDARDLTLHEAAQIRKAFHTEGIYRLQAEHPSILPDFRIGCVWATLANDVGLSDARYRACNLRALQRHGTIEFRCGYLGLNAEEGHDYDPVKAARAIRLYVEAVREWFEDTLEILREVTPQNQAEPLTTKLGEVYKHRLAYEFAEVKHFRMIRESEACYYRSAHRCYSYVRPTPGFAPGQYIVYTGSSTIPSGVRTEITRREGPLVHLPPILEITNEDLVALNEGGGTR